MAEHNFTKGQSQAGLTLDGRKWYQNCYICNKQINFIKDPSGNKWIRIDKYVRHRKCLPPPIKY
jgi:hypothetical protein